MMEIFGGKVDEGWLAAAGLALIWLWRAFAVVHRIGRVEQRQEDMAASLARIENAIIGKGIG